MNTIEAILSRTSYRGKYVNTKIPRSDLRIIMQAGLSAPSGCNKQTTSIVTVDDSKMLNSIYNVLNISIEKIAPAVIFVFTTEIQGYGNKNYNIQDYSAAVENMLLACVELGYQSCWIEGYINNRNEAKKEISYMLNMPDKYELACILPVGIAKDKFVKVKKKRFNERAWFIKFCAR